MLLALFEHSSYDDLNRLHIHVQSCNSYSGDAQQSSSQLSEAKVGGLTSHTISIFFIWGFNQADVVCEHF